MTPQALGAWLKHFEGVPHPDAGRYSALPSSALWRLHAVRRSRVTGVDRDDVRAGAQFVGVPAAALEAHLAAAGLAGPSEVSEHDREVARKWLRRRAAQMRRSVYAPTGER